MFNRVFSSDGGNAKSPSNDGTSADSGQSRGTASSTSSGTQGAGNSNSAKSDAQKQTGKPQDPPKAVAARPVVRAPNGLPIPQLPPTNGSSYAKTEVLGVNMSAAAIKRAGELGFTVVATTAAPAGPKSGAKPTATGTITRLITPSGLDANLAKDLLSEKLPSDQFQLNRIYRPYKAESIAPQAQRVEPSSPIGTAVPCRGDRCNGRKLVEWSEPARDQLRSCSKGLAVGIIDTGVERHHPNLDPVRISQGVFVSDGRTEAPNWHGTGVLALLAGDPRSGTPGLIPDAHFYSASVFFADGSNGFATDTVGVVKALRWMDSFGVKVVNMSFAGPQDELVEREIAEMSSRGVVFVAAAGNEGPIGEPRFPAAYKQVIAVTAINKEARNYIYSTRGKHIDVAAPGVDVWTAVPGAKEGYYSGTSFAAPFVTAMVASLYSQTASRNKEQLLAQLDVQDLGDPGRDSVYGRGLAKAPKSCAGAPALASAPASPPASLIGGSKPVMTGSVPVQTGWEPSVRSKDNEPRPATISAGFR